MRTSKLLLWVLVFALFAVIAVGAIGCSDDSSSKTVVTFYVDGIVYNQSECSKGNSVDLPAPPTKEDSGKERFQFAGWYLDKDFTLPFDNKKLPESDTVDAYAKFDVTTAYTIYTVNGNNAEELVFGDGIVLDEGFMRGIKPEKESTVTKEYVFEGWYYDKDFTEPFVTGIVLERDITIYAKITERTRLYTVRFYNNATLIDTQELPYGSPITSAPANVIPPEETDEYTYSFDYWMSTSNDIGHAYDLTKGITSDTFLYAHFKETRKQYTVSYTDGGTVIDRKLVYYGDCLPEPFVPTKAPDMYFYQFEGWYLRSNFEWKISFEDGVAPKVHIVNDMMVYAKFLMANAVYVDFFNGDILFAEQKLASGEYIRPFVDEVPVKAPEDGVFYEFDGWTTENGKSFSPCTAITERTTLYASFKEYKDENFLTVDEYPDKKFPKLKYEYTADHYAYELRNDYPNGMISGVFVTGVAEGEGAYTPQQTEYVYVEPTYNGMPVIGVAPSAFKNFSALKQVYLPNSVIYVGKQAFYGCTELEAIDLRYVEFMGDSVLSNSGIKHITASVFKEIGNNVFGQNNLKTANIIGDVYSLLSKKSISYFMGEPERLYLNGEIVTELTIPEGVTEIPDYAFYGVQSLRSVSLPSSLVSIGMCAFADCYGLTEITVPVGVTEIAASAFNTPITVYCVVAEKPDGWGEFWNYGYTEGHKPVIVVWDCENSRTVLGGDKYATVDGLEYVIKDGEATLGRQNAASGDVVVPSHIEVDGHSYPVTKVAPFAFYDVYEVYSVVLPNTVTEIGDYAFACGEKANKNSITYIKVPASVVKTERRSFASGLSTIVYYAGKEIPEGWAYGYYSGTVYVVDSEENPVMLEGYGNGCAVVDRLIYGLRTESGTAFLLSQPYALSGKVVIPDEITVNGKTFTVVEIEEGFSNCPFITEIVLPDSLVSVSAYAFTECFALEKLHIGKKVSNISIGAFRGCGALAEITADEANETFKTSGGCLYNTEKKTLIHIYGEHAVIPDGVKKVGNAAIERNSRVKTLVISDNVTVIERQAFMACPNLEVIIMGRGLREVGAFAFAQCVSLKEIWLSPFLKTLDNGIFTGSDALKFVAIPEGVTEIKYAFSDSKAIAFYIPKTVTNIGKNAFTGTTYVTDAAEIFFAGTETEWNRINKDIDNKKTVVRFYRENWSSTISDKYWHFVDGKPVAWGAEE